MQLAWCAGRASPTRPTATVYWLLSPRELFSTTFFGQRFFGGFFPFGAHQPWLQFFWLVLLVGVVCCAEAIPPGYGRRWVIQLGWAAGVFGTNS